MEKSFEDWMIPLIKGMIIRGDRQSDIAACFLVNSGRVAEIHNSMNRVQTADEPALTTRARPIQPVTDGLPPSAPYPSPYELQKAGSALWAARVALEAIGEKIQQALVAVENAEKRMQGK